MGPVTPLLAVYEEWIKNDSAVEAVWIGTSRGPEREAILPYGMKFFSLPVARLPRYFSIEWFSLPFKFVTACVCAMKILKAEKPNLVACAGGYTSVPVVLMAKILGIPIWVHEQDVHVILTNRLVVPFADMVTCAWKSSLDSLPSKTVLIGNPVRRSVLNGSKQRAKEKFGIHNAKPTVLIFGGGAGSSWINEVIEKIVRELVQTSNVIHLTGKGRLPSLVNLPDYHVREFLVGEMADALSLADVVVCRAGMGTITEIAALCKAAVLIPLPNSPQDGNAIELGDSCVVLDQLKISPDDLLNTVVMLLQDNDQRQELGLKIHNKLQTEIAGGIVELLRSIAK